MGTPQGMGGRGEAVVRRGIPQAEGSHRVGEMPCRKTAQRIPSGGWAEVPHRPFAIQEHAVHRREGGR